MWSCVELVIELVWNLSTCNRCIKIKTVDNGYINFNLYMEYITNRCTRHNYILCGNQAHIHTPIWYNLKHAGISNANYIMLREVTERQKLWHTSHGREVRWNAASHRRLIPWYAQWREVLWDISSHRKVIPWYVW